MSLVVYDTYAWVEYFIGSEKGIRVREYLRSGGVTPSVVLAELARKYLREGFRPGEVEKRLEFVASRTAIAPIDVGLSLRAAEVYLRLLKRARERSLRTPSLADAIVYATALVTGEDLLTGDSLFEGLDSVIYLG